MTEEHDDPQQTAEGEKAGKISEKLSEAVSGEGETPLGDTDQHSDAPGPHGLGDED